MSKITIDYHHIPARQDAIHYRLEDWARWVKVRPQAWKTHPMFRGYQSKARHWEIQPHIHIEINTLAAHEIERSVCVLPERNRAAIRWCYVFNYIPVNAIRGNLAVTRDGLAELITMGRDMLINRMANKIIESGKEAA